MLAAASLLLLVATLGAGPVPPLRDDYDFYVFATEWAPSACVFKKCFNWPIDDHMNIHGLWPSSPGNSPFECEPFNFDESNIDPNFKKELYSYWAGLYTPSWDFIKYECKKHGSCWRRDLHGSGKADQKILDILGSFDPHDPFGKYNVYLKLSVYLSQKMNTFEILRNAKIVPSDTQGYPIDDIIKAVNDHYGLTTAMIPTCKKDKVTDTNVIIEFRFCLDLDYSPIDCDPMVVRRNIQQCGKNPLTYPLKHGVGAEGRARWGGVEV